ncbi:high affinity copper uptake protein 1 [Dermacentor andersoni]|uniref:high affinity copper uptake protein 1 n=1 Tax=Dermacentor andersoni TaxID=34620 RepID=UPI002417EE58|nr:high affinity copper uptake protein 1-like [Dermacentor andersoni]XP_054917993.1 high affinity copper uptake protein 1-like [Dermacentor andersoni]XP_054917994.1 high affinity copper uptake protein 1-like [Dermacentor andersoni]XP_054917995.1 high affinity copper uptake protein 1-like [Dermacentor andersoni]
MSHSGDHHAHSSHESHGALQSNFTTPSPHASAPLQTVLTAALAAVTMSTPTDHALHDGSSHNHGHGSSHGSMDMHMYFHTGFTETILFKDWAVSSVAGMVGSVVGVFFMAALYEALKYFREHLFRLHFSSMSYSSVAVTGRDGHTLTEVHQIVKNRIVSWPHLLQTFLHMVQMVISYFLMLIFMTYNVWLCLGVVLGAGFGYFIFGWKKATVVDVTDHCH